MDNSDKAVRGAAAAAITAHEVRRLILAATEAWKLQKSLGITEDSFDAWRKGALWDAVRKTSFRALGQAEFGVALGHFLRLAGKESLVNGHSSARGWNGTNARIAARESGPEGDRRRAEWKLRRECEGLKAAWDGDADQALAYALVLLRTIHRAELATATAKQITQTLFTLRTRARARMKKTESVVIGKSHGSLGKGGLLTADC